MVSVKREYSFRYELGESENETELPACLGMGSFLF